MKRRTTTLGRRGSRGLETRAHANRSFKRVTRQWELSQNIKCQIVQAVPGAQCPNGGKIVIMPGAELRGSAAYAANANFPDAVRIKTIHADLYFRPDFITAFTNVQDCFANSALNQYTTYMRVGLKKAQGPQSQAGVPDALNPLNNGATPQELSDWADGQWSQMWEHVWDPMGRVTGGVSNNFTCCSTQAGYTVPGWDMATGSGDWPGVEVPPVVCQPCGDIEDPAADLQCGFEYDLPKWWHLKIRTRRTIVMKENDDLGLYLGWEKLMQPFDVDRPAQPNMQFFGGVKLLLES